MTIIDTTSCDRCVAPGQVSVFHPRHADQILRFCRHHHNEARAALAEQGWITIAGSTAVDQLAAV